MKCEVCGNYPLMPVINLGDHPIPDDLVKIGHTRECATYPVEVLFCNECKTAHQAVQVPKTVLFSPTYHYRAGQTQDVLDGMKQLVDSFEQKEGSSVGRRVLDIGCNDGSLLNVFSDRGAVTYGIEPTDACREAFAAGHTTYQKFFTPQLASRFIDENGHPDLVTFSNVFAHIENLPELLLACATLRGTHTRFLIENHYLGSVIERCQFDTFYHEHPRTYSYTSFVAIADTLGMHVDWVEFPKRYGGNIRVMISPGAGEGDPAVMKREENFDLDLRILDRKVKKWQDNKRRQLIGLYQQHGAIAAAAFPGRAAIILKLLGLNEKHISAIYEKPGSRKIGHYAPGTQIPILSDEEYGLQMSVEDTPLLNFAWHIPAEIEARWRSLGFQGKIIQAVDPDDFKD